jgi:hypothetical protein
MCVGAQHAAPHFTAILNGVGLRLLQCLLWRRLQPCAHFSSGTNDPPGVIAPNAAYYGALTALGTQALCTRFS